MTPGNRMICNLLGATGSFLWLATGSLLAQQQPAPTPAQQRAQALALEKKLPVPSLTPKASFDLSPARQERFQKYLPKLWAKLNQREPVRLLVLGDAGAMVIHEGKVTETFPGIFADRVAAQFFYTGGVQPAGTAAISPEVPAIYLRDLSTPGGGVAEAVSILASSARQTPVDVVLLCYGQADAGLQPPAFARTLNAAVSAIRALGAEPVLCSPWLPMAEKCEAVLGLARPLADSVRETANELDVLHADLGDLARLITLPPLAGAQEDERLFERIERTYREFFYRDAAGAFLPRPSLHRQLGGLIYKNLLDAPPQAEWSLDEAVALQPDPDKLTVTFTLRNGGAKDLVFTALPLIVSGWKPVDASPGVAIPAGAARQITLRYAAATTPPLPLQEALLRLPILVSNGSLARVETLHAAPSPAAIVWGLDTVFNQEKTFLTGCQIVNSGPTAIKGSWQADFAGQKMQGSVDLPAQGTLPLNLRFDLPEESPPFATEDLKVTLQTEGYQATSVRKVRMIRNLGLGQALPLLDPARQPSALTVTPAATPSALTFTFNLPITALPPQTEEVTGPAWLLELNLDARSYGKRLEAGSTATVRVTGGADDGEGRVQPVPAWAFGTGYAAHFLTKEFKAALATRGDTRQISLTLPRSYLYLHEWALDNGNSQLGLGLRLTLLTADGYRTYALPASTKAVNDIEALAVLELTAKPTPRVTVEVE